MSQRLIKMFTRNERGRLPVLGDNKHLHTDSCFRNHILSYEYLHGNDATRLVAGHLRRWKVLEA
jgi:hypothetical protein